MGSQPSGTQTHSPHSYSVCEGQGRREVLEVLEVPGGLGAPHSQCQEVLVGQEGQVDPECSLPLDPKNNKEALHLYPACPRLGLYLLIAPEVEVAFETDTSPAYHRAPFAGDMVLGQRHSPKASQCSSQKLGLCDAPPLGSAQCCSKLWDSNKRTTMRYKTGLAYQPHAHRGSERLTELIMWGLEQLTLQV